MLAVITATPTIVVIIEHVAGEAEATGQRSGDCLQDVCRGLAFLDDEIYDELFLPCVKYLRTDADLRAPCVRALPEISFVIVGPVTRVVEPLSALDNVFLLGPRPYGDIPAYLQHADVGIIPFRHDRMVDSIHPIKLYEYLAAGLPVVATRWREIEAMQAPVALAEREGFVETIRLVIQSVSESGMSAEQRREFARNNSWNQRYEQIKAILYAET